MLNLLYINEDNMNVYSLDIIFNGKKLNKLVINNPHIKQKHPEITDEEIYNLSIQLNEKKIRFKSRKNNFNYFGHEPIFYKNKAYRLAWCLEDNKNYLGITTCFRSRKYDK
ncbi:MAG: hypothetical protein AM1032_000144 [Mycoplasmataceae bacterium]|nr:MAG: hypothetical protein AM1032_000144 [Mycoplasmataceae bacterium]